MTFSKKELHQLIDALHEESQLRAAHAALTAICEASDQSWYWSEDWQEGEREADADKEMGRISEAFASVDDLMRNLRGEDKS